MLIDFIHLESNHLQNEINLNTLDSISPNPYKQNLNPINSTYIPHTFAQVPISLDYKRGVKDGVLDKEAILNQMHSALEIISVHKPNKILTLGGECSCSVAPFSYLNSIYKDEIALLYLDAHPDITLPYDSYKGFHAMAVTALLGLGDIDIINLLPSKIDSKKVLFIGLHSDETKFYAKRQEELELKSLTLKESKNPKHTLKWLKKIKAKKVLVHLDLDVLDKKELYVAVGNSGKLKIKHILKLLDSVSQEYEIVGLTIAEHFPKELLKLKELVGRLPLIR
ncbi:MAG: arginase family protein [Helicobacteraceae bacterium]|nr:arginase family protein [Helicobacteraceae bacterium]